MKIERILMPTDFSAAANAALTHAVFLAEQFQAELHLLHVVVLHGDDPYHPLSHFPDHEDIYESAQAIANSAMQERVGGLGKGSLQIVKHQNRALAAAPEILRFATEQGCDLIVMGAHGQRGLRRLLLGSVTEEVVRTAPCPVLTVREEPDLDHLGPFLVPVDFSERSRETLLAGKSLAQIYGVPLHVLHVVEQPALPPVYAGFSEAATQSSFPLLASRLGDALRDWVAEAEGPKAEVVCEVVEGEPGEAISRYALAAEVDLTIIASQGLRGLERLLLGSVSEKVLRLAECPVLTLRSGAEES